MAKAVRNCEECGKEFSNYPSRIGRFCSKRCSGAWTTRAGPPRRPRRGTTTVCPVCKKDVYRTETQRNNGIGVYCSRACHNVAQAKDKVRKQCARCGTPFELSPSLASAQFCSRRCMGDAKTKRPLDRMHNGRHARMNEQGYVEVWEPTHPKAVKGWVPEHRYVAEQTEGRYLESGEEVHHRNGRKDDNSPGNLQVLGSSEHAVITQQEIKDKMARLAEYEKRFGPLQ